MSIALQRSLKSMIISCIEMVREIGLLVKFKLTLTVVFSAVLSYLIVGANTGNSGLFRLLVFAFGGFCVTGASNILNEIFEKDFDAQMARTANRPLVTGKLSMSSALILCGIFFGTGLVLIGTFNILAALISAVSLIIYAFLYTPLKRVSPIAVTIGAIPGALPTLIGAVAVEGKVSAIGLMLFLVQFCWQFPHFWAIAYLGAEDYIKAGYRFIPLKDGKVDINIALQAFVFCLLLVAIFGFMFYINVISSVWIFLSLVGLSVVFGYFSLMLYKQQSREAALKLMFYSFFFLPGFLGLMWLDKF